jgi:beta-glucosidase
VHPDLTPESFMTSFAPTKGMMPAEIDATVAAILEAATLEEKVAMMSGKGFFRAMKEDRMVWGARPYRAGAFNERLGVPALWFTDGPRGVARGNSTCFPVTMARGASFDPDLERRIGEVMGVEVRAQECNLSGAVCVNLLRHPGWGRAQETYGEDPWHLGVMGAALATGIQTHNVIATVKHFALNSIENARFKVDVQIDQRTLREVYLPHFKMILDAGCASVMSAYNKMNGAYCGHNHSLLTGILRQEWGFDGFVHSDWIMGVYGPDGAAAGLDIENPEPVHYGRKLVAAVESGEIAASVVDTACSRILRTLYRFAAAPDPLPAYTKDMVASPTHVALALEAAEKSAVLLTNSGVLPLKQGQSFGVFGRLAGLINTGDNGSSAVKAPHIVTALEGLGVDSSGDERDPLAAAEAAAGFDVAIIVAGTTAYEEGEFIPADMGGGLDLAGASEGAGALGGGGDRGGDRVRLRLPDDQVALINAVKAANANTVVVLVCGSAIIPVEWMDGVGAILQTFYSGMEGGTALARLLRGEVSPSGKLPFTVAQDEADYPFFDKDADAITYGPWHGYTLMQKEARAPLFPFGFGLSYSSFGHGVPVATLLDHAVQVEVVVSNDGPLAATEVSQLYVGFPGTEVERPARLLRGFARVELQPGEARTVVHSVPLSSLRYWSESSGQWEIETGLHRFETGPSSDPAHLSGTALQIDG